MSVTLICAAAGTGSRFGGQQAKQFYPLAQHTVLWHSLHAYAGLVEEAIVVVHQDVVAQTKDLLNQDDPGLPWRCIVGGATRQESVHRGLLACHSQCTHVLVHDAARPLIHSDAIQRCLDALNEHQAAVLAAPCSATIKASDDQGQVSHTIPRDNIFLAETPQALHLAPALAAFAQAQTAGWNCSDDVQVMEQAGHKVHIVPATEPNIKITHYDDLSVAEALWQARLDNARS